MKFKIKEKPYHISKHKFINLVNELKIENIDQVKFEYCDNGNDPFNPCGTVKKQATYEFYVRAIGKEIMLVYKDHRRTHEIVQEELENKFNKWLKYALKNQ